MKLTTFFVFVSCIGFISYVVAGPSSANGPAQTDSDMYGMPVRVPTTHSGPAFTAGGQATAANASTNGSVDASSNGSSNGSSAGGNASSNGAANGLLRRNENAGSNGSISIGRGEEKMVETPARELAAVEAAEKSEKSEVTKKFESSILNQGIDEIANSKAGSKVPDFAPNNPVTGTTIPPRPSFSQPLISPIPSATVSPRPKD